MTIREKNRIWELDFLKGMALILMIYFHIIYDLTEYYNFNISYSSGINFYVGRFSAILFMILSGISCCLSINNFKRGLKLLVVAMIITLVTTISGPDYTIKFGILHLLGVSIILYEYVKYLNNYILGSMALLIIFTGNIMTNLRTESPYLFPIGIINRSFYSADYYPILPWFGVFLIGVIIGKKLYSNKEGYIKGYNNPLNIIGQRTLLIYLIHQPIILSILWLIYR